MLPLKKYQWPSSYILVALGLSLGILGTLLWFGPVAKQPPTLVESKALGVGVDLPLIQYSAGDSALLARYLQVKSVPRESISSDLRRPDPALIKEDAANAIPSSQATKHLGIILPHHLVAFGEIATLYGDLQAFKPDLILLLSPNHQRQPQYTVTLGASGLSSQRPEFSVSFTEDFSFQPNSSSLSYAFDDALLRSEHGLTNHLPFIIANFESYKLLPLAIARNASIKDLGLIKESLLDYIREKGYQRVLWIASIDFSHYLPASSAHKNDHETQSWIDTKNLVAILGSSEAHLDAPGVLSLFLMQFDSLNRLWHCNSALKLGYGFNEPGTSYMIYLAKNYGP